MIYTHNIHPIIVSIGPVDLYWYGAMYAISFLLIDYLMKREVVRDTTLEFNVSFIDQIVFISIVSVIIGGRLGYVLFYNIEYYAENFNKIFYIWEGGMSFHGALVGVYVGLLFLSITNKIKFFKLSDFLVTFIPIGLFLGRIGNFINSELYGSPTNTSWGVVFPMIDSVPRHPSMLYEAFLEGIVLYLILFFFKKTKPSTGILTAIFLIFYSVFRFCVEFVRVPDQHIGYIYSTWLTTGMILCVPMFFIGMLIYYHSKKGRI
jgi:phosphatidylglycerol:prolipoprotein diacylglycerol transferase